MIDHPDIFRAAKLLIEQQAKEGMYAAELRQAARAELRILGKWQTR